MSDEGEAKRQSGEDWHPAWHVDGIPARQDEAGLQMSISPRLDALGSDDLMHRRRLGIMGGTFDPIHFGHLICAESAREEFGLDGVIFMPTGNPSFKQDRVLASSRDRMIMATMATASNPWFDVSDLEARRGGITYTVDTLRQMRAHYPDNVDFYFITGSDSIRQIHTWKGADELKDLAIYVSVERPGYSFEDDKKLHAGSGFDIRYLSGGMLAISSTDIRWRLSHGRSVRYLMPDDVISYISHHGLYEAKASKEGK